MRQISMSSHDAKLDLIVAQLLPKAQEGLGRVQEQLSGFDVLMKWLAEFCGTSMAMFALIDNNTVHLAAKWGVQIDKIPRELSFCSLVMKNGRALIVTDTLNHETLAYHPHVIGGLKLRSYVGLPMQYEDKVSGEKITVGTVCVFDQNPREFNLAELSAMNNVGRLILQESVNKMSANISRH